MKTAIITLAILFAYTSFPAYAQFVTNTTQKPESGINSSNGNPLIKQNESSLHSNTDSLPNGITKDWLNKLRDKNGNRIIVEEPETDALQRKIFTGQNPSERFGYALKSAGDVNGDNYDDIIVGAYAYSTNTGRAYIYFGGTNMDTVADVTMTGETTNSEFGICVSSANDVNGDGYSDVIVGASRYSSFTGRAYIYLGGSSMDNVADVVFTGETVNNFFGFSSSSAGDVNGDGYSDVIIGARGHNSNTGKAYLYFGGDSMNNVADLTMTGGAVNDNFGVSVSECNVNGDAYSDVIVGASGYNSSRGRAYIFYGGFLMNNITDVILTGESANSNFGYSLSSAGDINGDWKNDVVVGAYGYNTSTGRAYIYYGGSPMNNVADVVMTGESSNNLFGTSVSSAGDINSDGYYDVIVGANGYNSVTGRAYVFFGAEFMNNTPDITVNGESANSNFGAAASSGDINGDGQIELIVGAWGYNSSGGRVYVFDYEMGGEPISDLFFNGEGINNSFGSDVSSAGDVNGDGYSDVVVGAESIGKAYIFYGGAIMNNIADVIMSGESAGDYFGRSVSAAGDVNNDGYSDIIVGARGENSFIDSVIGKAYIFLGGTSMNNIPDVTMTGEVFGDWFGYSVSNAGDLNGDNFSDVIVGAPFYPTDGRAYIYLGGTSMNNIPDVILNGELDTGRLFGWSVSSAGDINGDSYSDVVVGDWGYGAGFEGRVYIFQGGSFMDDIADFTLEEYPFPNYNSQFGFSVSSGDFDRDGYSDVIVGSPGYNGYTGRAYIYYSPPYWFGNTPLTGEEPGGRFGTSVSSTGDLNGDLTSDIIIGTEGDGSFTGKAFVFYGGGFNIMDNIADLTFRGETTGDFFGSSVSTAGDVNNDGISDLIIGANQYNSGTGRAYIYNASAIVPAIKKFFRTRVSGNWNSYDTWEMTTDGGFNYSPATTIPDITNGGITIRGPHTVILSESDSLGQLDIGIGGQLMIDTLVNLSLHSLINYGTISGGGTIEMFESNGSISMNKNSNFNVNCIIKSGYVSMSDTSTFKKKLTINSGAALYSYPTSLITFNNDLINNGSLGSDFNPILNGTFVHNGSSFINNGSITSTIIFTDTTSISGTGNMTGSAVNIINGSAVTLGSDHQFKSININSGGYFNITGKTLVLSNPGTPLIKNGTFINTNSVIQYNGTSSQNLTTNVNYVGLKINNPAGVVLSADSTLIPGLLHLLNGDLDLNGKKLILSSDSANLIETPGNTVTGTSGSIKVTRIINHPDSLNIAGLGAVITSSQNLGLTTITRTHNVQNVIPGRPSIKRNYLISPENNTALDADLVFKYDASELSGPDSLNEEFLVLFRSTNGGANYTAEGGIVDTLNNQIFLNYVQSFSSWSAARDSAMAIRIDSAITGNVYAKGKFPVKWGSQDTISVRILNPDSPNIDSIRINYMIKQRETFEVILDTIFTIRNFEQPDTIVFLRLPILNPDPYHVILQAIPGNLEPINNYAIQDFCFDVTCGEFSYSEPCDTISGAAGFSGKSRMVSGFTNLNTAEIYPIHEVRTSFLDSGAGNVPYKIAIYGNAGGKPGAALYISPPLLTPPGVDSVVSVTHQLTTPVMIPANSRFYVGLIQTTNTNIRASYQDEVPVRRGAFFFSNSDTNNLWHDFADSSKNFRLDITTNSGTNLKLTTLLEGFYNTTSNEMISDTVRVEVRSYSPPYDTIEIATGILDPNGIGQFYFLNVNTVDEYYFVIRHRNHIETWSSAPETLDSCEKQYDFTNAISKAYGDNLKFIDGKYMIFAGDVDQDGVVDATDASAVDNDASNFVTGYEETDLTGDNITDASDASLVDNNAANFVGVVRP